MDRRAERTRTGSPYRQAIRSSHLAERGGRRFSQAISEGDGISVIVEVDGPETARTAEADGAEGVVVRGALAGLRDATELPILWRGGGTPEDAMRAGADAVFVVAEEHDEDGDGVEALASHAAELGLDLVVSVSSEEVLERVLELHDPRDVSPRDERPRACARAAHRCSRRQARDRRGEQPHA
jgi:Indole-3-glycerol phosphate synthase